MLGCPRLVAIITLVASLILAAASVAQDAASRPSDSSDAIPTPDSKSASLLRDDVRGVSEAATTSRDSTEERDVRGTISDWIPAGAAIITAIVAIASIIVTARTNTKIVRESLVEKSREEERDAIRRQIDEFYGPFLQLRNASRSLYHDAFVPRRTEEERRLYCDSEGNFRTLLALMSGHHFQDTDATLLELIIEIGRSTGDLIFNKVGLVDDRDLQLSLSRATTHFRLIELAYESPEQFKDSGSEFEAFTFPSDLDDLAMAKLGALNSRLADLSAAAAKGISAAKR